MLNTLEHLSPSAEATAQLGQTLGGLLRAGDVVCLSGDLGAGKTTFAAGIGRGWGADAPLISPTFVIIRRYQRPQDHIQLYHLDTYRVQGAEDAETLGLADIFTPDHVVLVEWAEQIEPDLPPDVLWVRLEETDDDERLIRFRATGERSAALLEGLR